MIKYIFSTTALLLLILLETAFGHGQYTDTVLYTIPWGNNPGELSTDFQTLEFIEVFEPGPFAVSNNGELVICEHSLNPTGTPIKDFNIMKFDQNGSLICWRNIEKGNAMRDTPREIAILNSGEVAISMGSVPQRIFLLDSNLNTMHEITLPYSEPYYLSQFTPTDQGSFWLSFVLNIDETDITYRHYYKTEIFLDGSYSTPEMTWDDISNSGLPANYISPTGEPFLFTSDMYDYIYRSNHENSIRKLYKSKLNELGTEYDLVYTHTTASDPGWELFETMQNTGVKHFVTWSGDFYTIHATDPGMVLTKYTYQPE